MNKRHFPFLLLNLTVCIVCFSFLFASCDELNTEEDSSGPAERIVLTKSQQEVAAKGNDFAVSLLKESFRQNGASDLFLSPMSVTMLSSMIANGAEGETYAEIVKTLGMEGFSLDQVNDYYAKMTGALGKADPSSAFSLANSIWGAKDLPLKKSFKTVIEKTFDADAYTVDFSNKSTLKKVNDWCASKTSGMIPKMLDELSPMTRVLLINALYFQGAWETPFPKANTKTDSFLTLAGAKTDMPFMNMKAGFSCHQDETVSVVRMPYGNGAFEMVAIVPGGDFAAFMASLDMEKITAWLIPTHSSVQLKFPKFTADYDTGEQLPAIMKTLGMNRVFSKDFAELGGISEKPLYVSNMRQKARVEVDEEGTRAAAVTLADMRATSIGHQETAVMNFDRPFLYLIRENSTGAILFMGTKVK